MGPIDDVQDARPDRAVAVRVLPVATGAHVVAAGHKASQLGADHVPELAGFRQPLAGEIAARRSLLERLPFPVGYGVEIAMLLDAEALVGIDALAQADLGSRQNRHQPLPALSAMAYAVMVAAERRIHGAERPADGAAIAFPRDGALQRTPVAVEERPPLATLRSSEPAASGRLRAQ